MSFTWNWNYLWTGISVIASGITIWQAASARKAKTDVEKVKDQIHTYVFGNELSELIQKGTEVKQQISPLIATNINQKTVRGIDENKIISSALEFVSQCKVKSSLIKEKQEDITKFYEEAEQLLQLKKYSDVHKSITFLLEILEEERKKHI